MIRAWRKSMKQVQFAISEAEDFKSELSQIKEKNVPENKMIFHIFSETLHKSRIDPVIRAIRGEFPDAFITGASTNGNIKNGALSGQDIIVTCTVFEDPGTQLEVLAFPLTESTEPSVTRAVAEAVAQRPWVQAVEMLVTIRQLSMTEFCEDLGVIRPDVQVFGGGAFSEDINIHDAFIISGEKISPRGAVFILYGGPNLHVMSTYVTGWKPLSRPIRVTRSEGIYLKELDGEPAYDSYYRYLHIHNDRDFFKNTLEFPFTYTKSGVTLLRAPVSARKDGTLEMTADVDEGADVRIAYGDPFAILQAVADAGSRFEQFQPQAVMLFSCAARKFYWIAAAEGMQNIEDKASQETRPFESLAPTSGFYTSGEFIRTNGVISQHNVTLVAVGFREGDIRFEAPSFRMNIEVAQQMSMVQRLATFIKASNEELEEAYHKLEIQSITDGLTGILNRKEIQNRITSAVESAKGEGKPSLVMFDIDDFKHVNDTYGHAAGDRVLIALADLLKHESEHLFPGSSVGRWGGEEFMILMPEYGRKQAARLAEALRTSFSATDFGEIGHVTVSVGITAFAGGEDADALTRRVDEALYEAKAANKNCCVEK